MATVDDEQMVRDGGILPVADLTGRTVWDELGHRIGTLRGVETNSDGRIETLDVQRRWILGPHDHIAADGMRLEGADIIVPQLAVASSNGVASASSARSASGTSVAPVLVAGREGARARYGGLSPVSGIMGALVAFATCVLVAGVLINIANTSLAVFDLTASASDVFTTSAFWMALIALSTGAFLGGVTAGRASRFNGITNGLMVPVWAVAISAVFAAAGGIWGTEFNIPATMGIPNFEFGDVGNWAFVGIVMMLVAFAALLVFAAFGGILGELWNRRADHAMLDVVHVRNDTPRATASSHDAVVTEPVVVNDTTHARDASVLKASPVAPQPDPPHETDYTR